MTLKVTAAKPHVFFFGNNKTLFAIKNTLLQIYFYVSPLLIVSHECQLTDRALAIRLLK